MLSICPKHDLPVVDSVLNLVGHTPLLRVRRFAPDLELFAKLEYLQPEGSIKHRIRVGIIEAAELDQL
jgi:cysteine synthase